MPNTDDERKKFKQAVMLIANKYQIYIAGNPNLMTLLAANTGTFDNMVKFMDTGPFMTNFMISGKPAPQ